MLHCLPSASRTLSVGRLPVPAEFSAEMRAQGDEAAGGVSAAWGQGRGGPSRVGAAPAFRPQPQ